MTTRDDDPDPQSTLSFHRRHIDRIDRTIVALIAERARLMGTDLPEQVVSRIIAEASARVRRHE